MVNYKEEVRNAKEVFYKKTGIKISEKIVKKFFDSNFQITQGTEFYVVENLIIVSESNWDTKADFCGRIGRSSTVTDYTVRKIGVFDTERKMKVAESREKRLFRTTYDGVVGERYDVRISKASIKNGEMEVIFEDRSKVLLAV